MSGSRKKDNLREAFKNCDINVLMSYKKEATKARNHWKDKHQARSDLSPIGYSCPSLRAKVSHQTIRLDVLNELIADKISQVLDKVEI